MLCVKPLRASLTHLSVTLWAVLTALVEVATLADDRPCGQPHGDKPSTIENRTFLGIKPTLTLPPGQCHNELAHLKQTRSKSDPLARYCTTTITTRTSQSRDRENHHLDGRRIKMLGGSYPEGSIPPATHALKSPSAQSHATAP